jgi:membrane protein implicated in regulation of membrane protease activity
VAAVVVLLLVLALALVLLRVRAVRRERRRAQRRAAAVRARRDPAALVGRTALVVERIANAEAVGCVSVDGRVWTARSYDDGRVIEAGAEVEVVEMRGATALVAQEAHPGLRH